MGAKEIIFKHAERAIKDAKYTGIGIHDGNAKIHYGHLQWLMNRIEELEQEIAKGKIECTILDIQQKK